MSASEKTGLVSAVGTSFEIIKTLVNGTKDLGGEEDDIRRILSDQYVREKITKILCSKTEVLWTGSVIIDHNKTFEERVKPYGLVFRNLFENYKIETIDRKSKVELVLLRFNKKLSVDEVAKEGFQEKNLLMAGLEEVTALGVQHPNIVYRYAFHPEGTILAPGDSKKSPKGNYIEVPSLFWSGNISLSTHQFVEGASYYYSFLFVKSVSPANETSY